MLRRSSLAYLPHHGDFLSLAVEREQIERVVNQDPLANNYKRALQQKVAYQLPQR